ncbi:UMP kinase [Candidatus Woesearchaeota archaeon]|nr:UMP kinase [Candidatus Woesearchaeota archaeon]
METVVISLGGSVLAPASIDTDFLKSFRKLILKFSKKKRFVIICGGGKTAREYMAAASKVVKVTDDDLDWIGIHATRLNAQLLRNVFRAAAYRRVIRNPKEKAKDKSRVVIAAGWKPGRSTDHMAVLLAQNFKAQTVINITNTDYVYNKDPSRHKGALPVSCVCWTHFRKLIRATKWSPGLNTPFDPVAARAAEIGRLTVAIMGKDLKNLESFLRGKPFKGTLICPC